MADVTLESLALGTAPQKSKLAFSDPGVESRFTQMNPETQQAAQDLAGLLNFRPTLTSDFRDPARNAAVGGVPTSKHMTGDAFDVRTRDLAPEARAALFSAIKALPGLKGLDEGDHAHVERLGGATKPNAPTAAEIFTGQKNTDQTTGKTAADILSQGFEAPQVEPKGAVEGIIPRAIKDFKIEHGSPFNKDYQQTEEDKKSALPTLMGLPATTPPEEAPKVGPMETPLQGATESLKGTGKSLISPETLQMMLTGAAVPPMGTAMMAAYAPKMLKGVWESGKESVKKFEEGNTGEGTKHAIDSLTNLLFLALGGKEATSGLSPLKGLYLGDVASELNIKTPRPGYHGAGLKPVIENVKSPSQVPTVDQADIAKRLEAAKAQGQEQPVISELQRMMPWKADEALANTRPEDTPGMIASTSGKQPVGRIIAPESAGNGPREALKSPLEELISAKTDQPLPEPEGGTNPIEVKSRTVPTKHGENLNDFIQFHKVNPKDPNLPDLLVALGRDSAIGLVKKGAPMLDDLRDMANQSGFPHMETVNDFMDAAGQDALSRRSGAGSRVRVQGTELSDKEIAKMDQDRLADVPAEKVKLKDASLDVGDMFQVPNDDRPWKVLSVGEKIVIKDGKKMSLDPSKSVDVVGGMEGIARNKPASMEEMVSKQSGSDVFDQAIADRKGQTSLSEQSKEAAAAEAERSKRAMDEAQFARKQRPPQAPSLESETEGSNLFAKQRSILGSERGSLTGEKIPQEVLTPEQQKANAYVEEMTAKREAAREGEKPTMMERASKLKADVKKQVVDFAAPIEDAVREAQKKGGYEILPEHSIKDKIDRVLASQDIASQMIKDSKLPEIIQKTKNVDRLDQYLVASHAMDLAKKGVETGRDLAADQHLIDTYKAELEPQAKAVRQYGNKILDYITEKGLISKELNAFLKKEYPNHVPMNRVFDAIEEAGQNQGRGRGIASISAQNIVQKLKGSKREVESPLGSLVQRTYDAVRQGSINDAARTLASYKDLPGMDSLMRPLKEGEHASAKETFSYLDNGEKVVMKTTPEIAASAKLLNREQLGFIGRVVRNTQRLAKLGITGINLPFMIANTIKDTGTTLINNKNIPRPDLFFKAMAEAANHGEVYDKMVRNGSLQTSFEALRDTAPETVGSIRSGRSTGAKIVNTIRHPGDLIPIIEHFVGRGEEVNRIYNFLSEEAGAKARGMSPERAEIAGHMGARENTVNFRRKGELGNVLNGLFLYMNAGIQGARRSVRQFKESPIQTSVRVAATLYAPVAMATLWNLSDPSRKRIYQDISEDEKNNYIPVILPGAKLNEKGSYDGVIKIPVPKDYGSLTIPLRKMIEQLHGTDKLAASDIASAIFGTVSPVGLGKNFGTSLASTFTPQAIKPEIEAGLNKNFFTGADIVPKSKQNLPVKMQKAKDTTAIASQIADALGVSPAKVQHVIAGHSGEVGQNVLNSIDHLESLLGIIKPQEVGGRGLAGSFLKRFYQARGGEMRNKAFRNIEQSREDPNALEDLLSGK